MTTTRTSRATLAFEKALKLRATGKMVLRLYVAGASERSRRAIVRARELCQAEFPDNFVLDVIDVYQRPILARNGRIVATPTLVREFPLPVRRLIGNLTNSTGLFVGLDVGGKDKARS